MYRIFRISYTYLARLKKFLIMSQILFFSQFLILPFLCLTLNISCGHNFKEIYKHHFWQKFRCFSYQYEGYFKVLIPQNLTLFVLPIARAQAYQMKIVFLDFCFLNFKVRFGIFAFSPNFNHL